jgi:hypothetical protein
VALEQRREHEEASERRAPWSASSGYMRTLFAEFADDAGDAEVRCLLAFSLWIGTAPPTTAAAPGRRSYASRSNTC